MSTAVLQELADNPLLAHKLTVEQYHRLFATGEVEESAPFELLGGQIVRKIRNAHGENLMIIGTRHMTAVTRLGNLSPALRRQGCFMRTQGPVTLPRYDEPEPDGAVVRGDDRDYIEHHPTAHDVVCVIEIADASLNRDRGHKQQIYADAGIGVYLIVNLLENVVEVYTQPMKGRGRYGHIATLKPGRQVTIPTAKGKGVAVPVRRLLP